jgi:diguanylate cyclase (GGDEF)-like protein
MAPGRNLIRRLTRPVITNRRELATYVIGTTAICMVAAVAADVVNHLAFFDSWRAAIRSWSVTAVIVPLIAVPATWAIGRAHLDLHRAKLAADELGRTDSLTGLPNRRAVFEFAESADATAMVLVVFDIDRFKRVNDTHGHLAGDQVIQRVARMMVDLLGTFGCIGRIGGEEFMLVASGRDTDRLVAALSDFRAQVEATPTLSDGARITVTVSAGAAVREPGSSVSELYAEADRALYVAKSLGRNRISYSRSFEKLMDRTASRDEAMWRADAEAELKRRWTDDRSGFPSVA